MNTTTAPAPTTRIPGARVSGAASIGDLVVYTDQANPPTTYRVTGLADRTGDYRLAEVATEEPTWSDLLQYGWTFALFQETELDPWCDPWACTAEAGGEHGRRCVR